MTNTPRTDETASVHIGRPRSGLGLPSWGDVLEAYYFSRQLELDLNTANAQLEEAKKKRRELEAQNVERTRHINKVATWASQDVTGPWDKLEIQQWILNELAMALGGQPMTHSAWKPEAIKYGEQLSTALQRIEELEKEREPHYIEELIFARKVISELKPKLSDAENVIRVKDDALSKMEAELSILHDRIKELEKEAKDDEEVRLRLSDLLNATANTLKGVPDKLTLHSFHDLPEIAATLRARISTLEADGRRFKETLRAADDYIEGLEMVGGAGLPRTERQILKQKWVKYSELKAAYAKALSASADAPQDLKEDQA